MTVNSVTAEIIGENVARVRGEIAAACARAGRSPDEVTLIAVTKSVGREAVDALLAAGVRDLGESRVQDALAKFGMRGGAHPSLPDDVRLHMIGNLQTNKARDAARSFAVVHSLNRPELATALDRACHGRTSPRTVLLEVNISGEVTKQGVRGEDVRALLRYVVNKCPMLSLDGLMTIAPHTEDRDAVRAAFRCLRNLRDELRHEYPTVPLPVLSMGMSDDYSLAVEEGATHVRVGRALFAGIEAQKA